MVGVDEEKSRHKLDSGLTVSRSSRFNSVLFRSGSRGAPQKFELREGRRRGVRDIRCRRV